MKALKLIGIFAGALACLGLALGHWGIFFTLLLAGGGIALAKAGTGGKAKYIVGILSIVVLGILYMEWGFPFVDSWMTAHYPVFWDTIQQQKTAKDIQYGKDHPVSGSGIEVAQFRNAKIMEQADEKEFNDSTAILVQKRANGQTWTHEDSLAYKRAQIRAAQNIANVKDQKVGNILEVADTATVPDSLKAKNAATSSSGPISMVPQPIQVDVANPDPAVVTIPAGYDLVMWVDTAWYTCYGGQFPGGVVYIGVPQSYEGSYCGAGGFPISPRKSQSPFPSAFVAPDLNIFSTVYSTSVDSTWHEVYPSGKFYIAGADAQRVEVRITVNDRKNTFAGNSGELKLTYCFKARAHL